MAVATASRNNTGLFITCPPLQVLRQFLVILSRNGAMRNAIG
jgi:hypothetical protein